jgi:hypothetical protein
MRKVAVYFVIGLITMPVLAFATVVTTNLQIQVTGTAAITALSFGSPSFTGGAADGTVIGGITVTTSNGSTPTLSLTGTTTGSGNDKDSFRISGTNLLTNTAGGATDQPGQYSICVVASGAYSNSPQQSCGIVQATGPGGAGWQLAFSDEFNGTMLNQLSTYPITSITWSNNIGTVVLPQPATAITTTLCFAVNTCTVSIIGATNSGSGGNSLVNGNFLVQAVTDSQHFTLWMPLNPGATTPGGVMGTIGTGSALLGTGLWNTTLSNTPTSSSCTTATPCSPLPMAFHNDDQDKEYYNPQNCVVTGGVLQMIATNDGPYKDPQGNTSSAGQPYSWGACHISTGPGGKFFAQAGEVFEDSYQKMPHGPGLHVNQMELLGSNNNWYCGGYIAAEGFTTDSTGGSNLVHLTTNGSGSSSNTNCLSAGNNSYTVSWSAFNFDAGFHQLGIDYNPAVSTQFYGDTTLLGSTVYANGFMPPNLAYGISPMYIVSNVAINDAYAGAPNSTTFAGTNGIFYIDYIRLYKKVASGACYSAIPAHGTIPHTGNC